MRVLAALTTAVLATLTPQAALAAGSLQPGVHVDPGSPAGKEYELPIPTARNELSGAPGGSNANDAPLFGAGITPPARASSTDRRISSRGISSRGISSRGGSVARTRGADQAHPRSPQLRTLRRASAPPPPSGAGLPSTSGVGSSGWLALVAGGALVLVIGGGGGLALRRRLSRA